MTFSDPILDGDVLIRDAIQSPDYVPGESGWAVKRDGGAEFSRVTMRGDLSTGPTGELGHTYLGRADPIAVGLGLVSALVSRWDFGRALLAAVGQVGVGPAAAGVWRLLGHAPGGAFGDTTELIVATHKPADAAGDGVVLRGGSRLPGAASVEVRGDAVTVTAATVDIVAAGRSAGRGLWAAVSSAVSSADVDTHTAVLTTPTATYRAGRAYEARMFGGVATSAATVAGDFRFWKAGGSGFLGEFGKFPAPSVGTAFQAIGSGLLFRVPAGAADVVCQLQLTVTPVLGAAGSTARHAAVGGPRRFTVWDVGAAADFPDAAVLV